MTGRWPDATVEHVADLLRTYDDEHDAWFWEDLAVVALDAIADSLGLSTTTSEEQQP